LWVRWSGTLRGSHLHWTVCLTLLPSILPVSPLPSLASFHTLRNMARISVLVLVLVVVAMVTLSLSVASVSAQTSHRNCFRFVSSYKFNQRVWYVMNICSCSLRAQVVNIGLSPATTNTTVLNIPAWDGTKNTRNIGTCAFRPGDGGAAPPRP